ncbi:hypothetical protein GFL82_35060 [Rhizobium laguerreae]|nr:hypothetical protein [Rhizobium laguerreae]NKM73106.1 hypothetical protein [Rhizobium laguerreae]
MSPDEGQLSLSFVPTRRKTFVKVPSSISVIPVLVTGIQPPRVGAVNDPHRVSSFPAPKDLGALDSCDEHRNDGGEVGRDARGSPHHLAKSLGSTQVGGGAG